MRTVNYLRVIDCAHDAAKYNEELQNRRPKQQEETYVGLLIHQLTKPLKIPNSTSTGKENIIMSLLSETHYILYIGNRKKEKSYLQ